MPFAKTHLNSRRGILYVATGKSFLSEAASNAVAARRFSGSLPIVVCTDLPIEAKGLDVFDKIITHTDPRRSYRDKIPPFLQLPFQETLYLDTDARVIAPVEELFYALRLVHISAVFAPVRKPDGWFDDSVPILFPELNSGVILFRRSWRQKLLIRHWLHLYDRILERHQVAWDQATFRSALWLMQQRWGLRFSTLPAEANLRTTKPWIAGKGLPVHIVHGRIPEHEWPALEHYLNGRIDCFRHWAEWQAQFPNSSLRLKVAPDPVGH